jgi:hypothetical protein
LIRPIERLLQSNTVDLSGCKTKSRPMEWQKSCKSKKFRTPFCDIQTRFLC